MERAGGASATGATDQPWRVPQRRQKRAFADSDSPQRDAGLDADRSTGVRDGRGEDVATRHIPDGRLEGPGRGDSGRPRRARDGIRRPTAGERGRAPGRRTRLGRQRALGRDHPPGGLGHVVGGWRDRFGSRWLRGLRTGGLRLGSRPLCDRRSGLCWSAASGSAASGSAASVGPAENVSAESASAASDCAASGSATPSGLAGASSGTAAPASPVAAWVSVVLGGWHGRLPLGNLALVP